MFQLKKLRKLACDLRGDTLTSMAEGVCNERIADILTEIADSVDDRYRVNMYTVVDSHEGNVIIARCTSVRDAYMLSDALNGVFEVENGLSIQ